MAAMELAEARHPRNDWNPASKIHKPRYYPFSDMEARLAEYHHGALLLEPNYDENLLTVGQEQLQLNEGSCLNFLVLLYRYG